MGTSAIYDEIPRKDGKQPMKIGRILIGASAMVLAIAGTFATLRAQQPSSGENFETDKRIIQEIKDRTEIMVNLEYLSDMIGARLTGTENMDKASHWTEQKFTQYGLSNVHLEPWTVRHAWYRGTAEARIVGPAVHQITLAAAGWSPSTDKLVRGAVVYVKATNEQELNEYRDKLRNAIVITAPPNAVPGPYQAPLRPETQPYRPVFAVPFAQTSAEFFDKEIEFFKQEGVLAVLRDSDKPDGLLTMTGIGGRDYNIGPLPMAFTSHEDYLLIWRLLERGPVSMEIEITNSFSEKPVTVYNTIAELPGTNPNEVVIIGAHLDSWDLAEGSTDNGTGSMSVLEAARALKALGLTPKRTIRFVLFSGEEEGLVGSRAYVQSHKAELDRIDAVLIHDSGSGRVLTLGLYGNYQDRALVDRVLWPLNQLGLGLTEPTMLIRFGSDHASFNEVGVPGFWCVQDQFNYSLTHHSQVDSFDKADKDNLIQGAQLMAAWAWNTAELPEKMPRKPLPEEPNMPF
jgi:hypothetical protein